MRVATTLVICFFIGLVEISLADRSSDSPRRRRPSSSTSATPVACPRRRPCTKDCGTRGFMRSDNGCELCACNPAPDCPALECPDSNGGVCPFGWKEDEHGCRLCECKANPRCIGEGKPICMRFCPNGFVYGPDGCPTCQCYDPATFSQLPAAAATDVVATSTQPPARTRPGPRRQPGVQHHQRGGRDGTAAPPSVSHHVATTSSRHPTCGPICRKHCQYGFQLRADGCPVCTCNESPSAEVEHHRGGDRGGRNHSRRGRLQCQRPTCAMYCPNGYRREHTGCTLCECQQPGDATFRVNTGTELQCQPLACHQTMSCAHGFATDQSSGCPLCVCRGRSGQ